MRAIVPFSQSAAQMRNYIYLLADATSRECYAVDACWDPNGIAAYAASQKLKLVGSIASHYHFDHVGGAVPPQMAAMVFGPFGAPKDAKLPGLAEMAAHGCKVCAAVRQAPNRPCAKADTRFVRVACRQLYAHSSELPRIAKQCMLPAGDLTSLDQGSKLPLGSGGRPKTTWTRPLLVMAGATFGIAGESSLAAPTTKS